VPTSLEVAQEASGVSASEFPGGEPSFRAGRRTGEVELDGDTIQGMTVHIGARVAALRSRGEVLVSSTVKDLVVDPDLASRAPVTS
jgi:class 3 adenylate cyclase